MSSVTVEIDVSQIVALAGSAAKARPVIARRMEYAMVRSTAAVERDAESAVPWDTGHLRRSITSVVTPRSGTLSEPIVTGSVGTNLVYGPGVEYGIAGAFLDQNQDSAYGPVMPPPGSLVGWMRRHNMDPANEYALARHIYQYGTKAQPFLGPALDQNRRGIEKEFQLAADRALKDILSNRGRF